MSELRALTLHQPWASLVAVGAKTIETRSWPTSYRGPLLIHAGKATPNLPLDATAWIGPYMVGRWTDDVQHVGTPDEFGDYDECDCDHDEETVGERCLANSEWDYALLTDGGAFAPQLATKLPLGAVVASCRLVECVPTENVVWFPDDGISGGRRWGLGDNCAAIVQAERPFGDFSPGRWAWLLSDVKPTTERCPRCWGTGTIDRPVVHVGGDYPNPDDRTEPAVCPTCRGLHGSPLALSVCAPVPMRGRQGLWTPNADDWVVAA